MFVVQGRSDIIKELVVLQELECIINNCYILAFFWKRIFRQWMLCKRESLWLRMQGSLFLEYSRAFGNGNVLWIHKGIHAEIEQTMSDFLHVSGCWCEVSFCISEELLLHHCIIQTGIGIRKQNLHNLNDCFIYLIFIELLRK